MFQKAGTTAKKGRLLDPPNLGSLADGTHSMPSLWTEVSDSSSWISSYSVPSSPCLQTLQLFVFLPSI